MRDDKMIDDAVLITRNADVMTAAVRDETMMMDVDTGRYYGLDDIGSEIWRRLEPPCRFGDLVDRLARDYDAERAVIARDVQKLLRLMAENKLVRLTGMDAE